MAVLRHVIVEVAAQRDWTSEKIRTKINNYANETFIETRKSEAKIYAQGDPEFMLSSRKCFEGKMQRLTVHVAGLCKGIQGKGNKK